MDKRKQIEKDYPDSKLLFADGFDDAIIGVAQKFNIMSVAYNRDKCIEILMKDMNQLEAIEYFEFNVIGSYVGEQTPTLFYENWEINGMEEKDLKLAGELIKNHTAEEVGKIFSKSKNSVLGVLYREK